MADENEDFESLGDYINQQLSRFERMMFINDAERGLSPLPLTPEEFESIFGQISEEDFTILTEAVLGDTKNLNKVAKERRHMILDKWGDWIGFLLQKNVEYEYYEKCAVLRDRLNSLEKIY